MIPPPERILNDFAQVFIENWNLESYKEENPVFYHIVIEAMKTYADLNQFTPFLKPEQN